MKLSNGELTIKFSDTQDLENQLQNIEIDKIDCLLTSKINPDSVNSNQSKKERVLDDHAVTELGTINLLKISEGGRDATKLAIFLASNGLNREYIKKITGITLLSD